VRLLVNKLVNTPFGSMAQRKHLELLTRLMFFHDRRIAERRERFGDHDGGHPRYDEEGLPGVS
jgi:hypothetical protein